MNNLISKYNIPVPRYTSYPPANFFHERFSETDFWQAVERSNSEQPEHLSFYIHIPYCKRMCYYCGCNSFPMAREAEVQQYMAALSAEIDRVCERIDKRRKISQIHYGGGSPTSVPLHYLQKINRQLLGKFDCIDNPEIAVECHAGYMDGADFEQLIAAGFNRISIGIQDFNLRVLAACNRMATRLAPEEIFAILRHHNVRVNLDFIYGLPLQTPESFAQTIQKAADLQPDRLVTFSYAHVPHLFPHQKLMERNPLPENETKNAIYRAAQEILLAAGYVQVGIDHFVKADDELFAAQQHHTLHRNFQGYCTRRTTGQVYAFGVTAISQLASAYAQNTKNIAEYIKTINNGRAAVKKGYTLNADEQVTREAVTQLMCNERIDWQDIALRMGRSVADAKLATAYSDARMREFANDGIIHFDDTTIEMREKGLPFVRNVAASLDKLLINTDKMFSKPV